MTSGVRGAIVRKHVAADGACDLANVSMAK